MQFWALQGLNFSFIFKYSSAVLAFNYLIPLNCGRACPICFPFLGDRNVITLHTLEPHLFQVL